MQVDKHAGLTQLRRDAGRLAPAWVGLVEGREDTEALAGQYRRFQRRVIEWVDSRMLLEREEAKVRRCSNLRLRHKNRTSKFRRVVRQIEHRLVEEFTMTTSNFDSVWRRLFTDGWSPAERYRIAGEILSHDLPGTDPYED